VAATAAGALTLTAVASAALGGPGETVLNAAPAGHWITRHLPFRHTDTGWVTTQHDASRRLPGSSTSSAGAAGSGAGSGSTAGVSPSTVSPVAVPTGTGGPILAGGISSSQAGSSQPGSSQSSSSQSSSQSSSSQSSSLSGSGRPGGSSTGTTPSGSGVGATASTVGSAGPSAPPITVAPGGSTAVSTGRRGLWNAIGRTPSAAELDAAPALYGVVVLNPWETAALRRLKQLDPSIVVLAYKDLSSSRSYDSSAVTPAGVGWTQATANPSWFATDTGGGRIEWSGYPGHWQMAVWDPGYQAAWAANVSAEVGSAGWDGVMADNDLSTLHWYSGRTLAGTSSPTETDAKLRAGLQVLVDKAGAALKARGKILVPNVSDSRLYPGRWAAHSRWGGAMEENFAHFGTDEGASSFVTDWGSTGWVDQTAQVAQGGLALAITRAAPGDVRTLRYGYASLLVRGSANSFWQPSADSAGDYSRPQSIPELAWRTGAARTAGTQLADGGWVRSYDGVWAAVNPTKNTITVTAPAGAVDALGHPVGAVQLVAASGIVLRTA